jgi:hypothetical protein
MSGAEATCSVRGSPSDWPLRAESDLSDFHVLRRGFKSPAGLRLFDELTNCDTEGILKEVRDAAEGNVER